MNKIVLNLMFGALCFFSIQDASAGKQRLQKTEEEITGFLKINKRENTGHCLHSYIDENCSSVSRTPIYYFTNPKKDTVREKRNREVLKERLNRMEHKKRVDRYQRKQVINARCENSIARKTLTYIPKTEAQIKAEEEFEARIRAELED